jgi:hypothetical protein
LSALLQADEKRLHAFSPAKVFRLVGIKGQEFLLLSSVGRLWSVDFLYPDTQQKNTQITNASATFLFFIREFLNCRFALSNPFELTCEPMFRRGSVQRRLSALS